MRVHMFVDSGYTTLLTDRPICRVCGCVKDFRIHDLPETPAAVREIDERRLGERV